MGKANHDTLERPTEKIDAKVKAYKLANQEITTKFDEYGNVLGVYVDGKYDAELTNILQEAIRTQNFNMIKGFGSGFIDQLANNNGKSLLNEWFGERKVGAELSGTKNYAVGQFVADLASLARSVHCLFRRGRCNQCKWISSIRSWSRCVY
ncbi:hypothetical protein [Enterococcus sp. AZ126]|uniref:hypothetical protein n=1 Tax=Enterococcus sp. AZ126 TaxID=2774635 RepID=UPI003F1EEFCA